MKKIAEKIVGFDVVFLQEIWLQEDVNIISSIVLEHGLIYSHWYNSGILASSGLLILSRFNQIHTQYLQN